MPAWRRHSRIRHIREVGAHGTRPIAPIIERVLGSDDDHRFPRPLHHRAQGAGDVAQPPDRRHQGPVRDAEGVRPADQRRRAARVDREQPAEADARARPRPHDLQPARELHGASHRRLPGVEHLGGDLQRAVLPRERAVSRPLHSGRDAAAKPGRRSRDLHPRARQVRRGVRQRRDQPEPRSVGRPLDQPAAVRPLLVSDLREDGRVRHPGDDPREHELQRVLPHHRRALPQRRHDRVHAVPDLGPVQATSRRCAS